MDRFAYRHALPRWQRIALGIAQFIDRITQGINAYRAPTREILVNQRKPLKPDTCLDLFCRLPISYSGRPCAAALTLWAYALGLSRDESRFLKKDSTGSRRAGQARGAAGQGRSAQTNCTHGQKNKRRTNARIGVRGPPCQKSRITPYGLKKTPSVDAQLYCAWRAPGAIKSRSGIGRFLPWNCRIVATIVIYCCAMECYRKGPI